MSNYTILARGVECLKYDQQRLIPIRVKQVLQLVHAFDVFLYLGKGPLVAFVFTSVGGIDF